MARHPSPQAVSPGLARQMRRSAATTPSSDAVVPSIPAPSPPSRRRPSCAGRTRWPVARSPPDLCRASPASSSRRAGPRSGWRCRARCRSPKSRCRGGHPARARAPRPRRVRRHVERCSANFAHHNRHLTALRLVEPRLPGERRPHPPRFPDQARVAHPHTFEAHGLTVVSSRASQIPCPETAHFQRTTVTRVPSPGFDHRSNSWRAAVNRSIPARARRSSCSRRTARERCPRYRDRDPQRQPQPLPASLVEQLDRD